METDPPIWRRLRVPGDVTLVRLDRILQTAMGWTNSHIHTFTAGGVTYADPNPEWDVRNERRARLDGIAREEGEGACPPEDSGGVPGYYEKLECLRDPDHDAHEETKVLERPLA